MADTVKLPMVGAVKKQTVWIGAAAVAGIVGIAWVRRGQQGAPAEITQEDQFVEDGTEWPYRPGGTSVVDSNPVDPSTLPPATNDEWARRAQNMLVESGYDPGVVATTLGRYLGRLSLDKAQEALIRAALALVGPVPKDQPGVILTPAPVAPETKTVTVWETHNVAAGTLRDVAARFAGNPSNPTSVESALRSLLKENPILVRSRKSKGNSYLGPSKLRVPVKKTVAV